MQRVEKVLPFEYEHQIAVASAAGQEAMAVHRRVIRSLTPEQKVCKAFELTEMTRRTMLASIRQAHPNASAQQIQELYVRRLLACQGINYDEIVEAMRRERNPAAPATLGRST